MGREQRPGLGVRTITHFGLSCAFLTNRRPSREAHAVAERGVADAQ
jgi:hypothetical protein